MTLNSVIAVILRYFNEFGIFGSIYSVEVEPRLFATNIYIVAQKNLVFANGPI